MKLFFVVLLLLNLSYVFAERVTLYENQSYFDEGKNITLLEIDNVRDKALLCINNEQAIVSENKQKTVNEVSFNLKSVSRDSIKIDIDVYCKNCECDNNCLNLECAKQLLTIGEAEEETPEEKIIEEGTSITGSVIGENEEIVENQDLSIVNISLALSILVVFSFVLYYLIKR